MTGQSTLDDLALDANTFYRRVTHVLSEAQVPFLVGGSHAFLHYTGIVRNTKDFDLFVRPEDRDRALEELGNAGYRTEISFPHWLGKAFSGPDFVDVVFSSGNGVCRVDDEWFDHAVESSVLGMPVRLMPAEELIWAKSFIMERERFDGADVVHLIRHQADRLNWDRLLHRFDRHWQLLMAYLVFFGFVYPSDRSRVPEPVMRELIRRSTEQLTAPPVEDRVCQGTLVSRSQYMIDLGLWGYRDARVAPFGSMSAEETVYWTWAIENIR